MTRALVLKMFFTMFMVAALVAGPASKKTRAAPGFRPFRINAAAIGVDEVAQTYIGIPAASMTSIDKKWCSFAQSVRSSGKKKVMTPAMNIPMMNGFAISVSNSPKAYLAPLSSFSVKVSLFSGATAQLFCLHPQPLFSLIAPGTSGRSSFPKKF